MWKENSTGFQLHLHLVPEDTSQRQARRPESYTPPLRWRGRHLQHSPPANAKQTAFLQQGRFPFADFTNNSFTSLPEPCNSISWQAKALSLHSWARAHNRRSACILPHRPTPADTPRRPHRYSLEPSKRIQILKVNFTDSKKFNPTHHIYFFFPTGMLPSNFFTDFSFSMMQINQNALLALGHLYFQKTIYCCRDCSIQNNGDFSCLFWCTVL